MVDGVWSNWGSWGACPVSCGGGNKQRTRQCDNPAPAIGGQQCPGSDQSTTTCSTNPCTNQPINGVWSNWGSWSSCTVSCGGGNKQRTRQCDNPAPSNGGQQCPGNDQSSTTCSTTPCGLQPVDGAWSNWGAWSSCTVSCGGGDKRNTRQCNNPAPSNGGQQCSGDNKSTGTCNRTPCTGLENHFLLIKASRLSLEVMHIHGRILVCIFRSR